MSPRKAWWHVDLGTYCAWLPGDNRGFRNRDHRIHSSGDYRNPPPVDEHKGLREYNLNRHAEPVRIPRAIRLRVATAIAEALNAAGHNVLVVSVADKHAHIEAELPIDLAAYRKAIGDAKLASSRSITELLPGRIWARGDKHDMLRDESYRGNVYGYVRDRQGPRAAVWCHDGLRREAMID
jgi:hypothetical protein